MKKAIMWVIIGLAIILAIIALYFRFFSLFKAEREIWHEDSDIIAEYMPEWEGKYSEVYYRQESYIPGVDEPYHYFGYIKLTDEGIDYARNLRWEIENRLYDSTLKIARKKAGATATEWKSRYRGEAECYFNEQEDALLFQIYLREKGGF